MSDKLNSAVTEELDSRGIAYEVIEIPLTPDRKPVRSLEDVLAAQGRDPGQIVRSLLFRTGSGDFVMLAAAGGGRADWAILRKHLSERRLSMAEAEDVTRATGYVIGAVPPIALPDEVRVLVDEGVFEFERVVIGSGVLGYALDLAVSDLRTLLADAESGRFVKT